MAAAPREDDRYERPSGRGFTKSFLALRQRQTRELDAFADPHCELRKKPLYAPVLDLFRMRESIWY
jgi:hypothetical protein